MKNKLVSLVTGLAISLSSASGLDVNDKKEKPAEIAKKPLSIEEFQRENPDLHPSLKSEKLEDRLAVKMAHKSPTNLPIVMNSYFRQGEKIAFDYGNRKELLGNEVFFINGRMDEFHGKYLMMHLIDLNFNNAEGKEVRRIVFNKPLDLRRPKPDYYNNSMYVNLLWANLRAYHENILKAGLKLPEKKEYVFYVAICNGSPEKGDLVQVGEHEIKFTVDTRKFKNID